MFTHMEIVDESREWPYAGPDGYRPAFSSEAENWANIPEAIQVRHFADSHGTMYDEDMCVTDVWVPIERIPVEDCDFEFGEHEHSARCASILDGMSYHPYSDVFHDIEYKNYMYGNGRY